MNNIQPILKQLREAESKATKGEWFSHKEDISTDKDHSLVGYPPQDGAICNLSDGEYIENKNHEADASLIVLMRNNLIPLLDYVEELEKENHFLRVTNGMPPRPLNITSADSSL